MTRQTTPSSDHKVSRLRSAAGTGSLKAVIGELATICKETTLDQCSKLTRMMPGLSVEPALQARREID